MDKIEYAELANLDGEEFVESCYAQLLRRAADPSGKTHFLSRLMAGEHKAVLIQSILSSPEARQAGVQVVGLQWRYRVARATRVVQKIPLLGSFVAAAILLMQARRVLDDIRRIDARDTTTQKSIAQSLRDVQPLLEPMRNLVASVPVASRVQIRAIGEMERQLRAMQRQMESCRNELVQLKARLDRYEVGPKK